ncbi:MAG: hypothetical protein O9272_08000 [Brevundimonas sp.]|nr:hypothetical protein [Brevundimonas sp.]MCZ8322281.1 hypothetical protein [Novosphingobium sp.]
MPPPSFSERQRASGRQRLTGIALALLAEAVLVLVVLSMGLVTRDKPPGIPSLVAIDVAPPAPEPAEDRPEPAAAARPVQQSAPVPPEDAPVIVAAPPTAAPPVVVLSRSQMAQLDISNLPRQPAPPAVGRPVYGPRDLGVPGDSKRVGSAPNGQPMYAASWYREPYDSELSGYLSTASGPGWALIACRTAPDFRVEDCVGLGEYPQGSQLERAVLAAAWQFKVRPPRVGGVSKVGEWVRIRIEYGLKPRG